MKKKQQLYFGIVKVTGGSQKGRIGIYDDDDGFDNKAIVYFGIPFCVKEYYLIPQSYLIQASVYDLMLRHQEIHSTLAGKADVSTNKRADLLAELSLVGSELTERMFTARLTNGSRKNVFISHSSRDKEFAKYLAAELADAGHSVWLDEWKIKVGESIPLKISQGIKDCDALIVVLSEHAVSSKWVENEWHAKYWDEVSEGRVMVLPVLLKECEIPTLLKAKKYADFTKDYARGLESLLVALNNES